MGYYMYLRAKLRIHRRRCSLIQTWLWIWWKKIFQWSFHRFSYCLPQCLISFYFWRKYLVFLTLVFCSTDTNFCMGELFLLWICSRFVFRSYVPVTSCSYILVFWCACKVSSLLLKLSMLYLLGVLINLPLMLLRLLNRDT